MNPRRDHGNPFEDPRPLALRPSAAEALGRFEPLTLALVIAALYFGRDVIVPVVLAGLLAFVLHPLVTRLARLGLPRTLAVLGASALALALIASLGMFVTGQARQLAAELPTYQANVTKKLREVRATLARHGAIEQVTKIVQHSAESTPRDTTEPTPSGRSAPAATAASPEAAPVSRPAEPARVEVVTAPPSSIDRLRDVIDALAGPLATAGIVLVLVILILLDHTEIRDRLLRLLGRDLHRNTDAMEEVGRRVSRYLVMQLLVNSLYAVPLALGLWAIGVPGALLWGVLAALLRFVPYIGPMIASAPPLLLAVAIDPGWSMALWTLALIAGLELISNNIIEPWLYGSSTGLSALSLVVAAIFWSAVWGPVIGLLVSTPLTVTILVLSRHVPQMAIFDLLLGNQPVLDTATRCYQRLVAGDHDDAGEIMLEHARAHGAADALETIAGPVLSVAHSAHLGEASDAHRERFVAGMGHLLAEMREQFHVPREADPVVVCVGPRDRLDALGADVLAHVLELDGLPCGIAEGGESGKDWMSRLDPGDAAVIALTYLDGEPSAAASARMVSRRLKRRWPERVVVVVGGPDEKQDADSTAAPWIVEDATAILPTIEAARAWARKRWPRPASEHDAPHESLPMTDPAVAESTGRTQPV